MCIPWNDIFMHVDRFIWIQAIDFLLMHYGILCIVTYSAIKKLCSTNLCNRHLINRMIICINQSCAFPVMAKRWCMKLRINSSTDAAVLNVPSCVSYQTNCCSVENRRITSIEMWVDVQSSLTLLTFTT